MSITEQITGEKELSLEQKVKNFIISYLGKRTKQELSVVERQEYLTQLGGYVDKLFSQDAPAGNAHGISKESPVGGGGESHQTGSPSTGTTLEGARAFYLQMEPMHKKRRTGVIIKQLMDALMEVEASVSHLGRSLRVSEQALEEADSDRKELLEEISKQKATIASASGEMRMLEQARDNLKTEAKVKEAKINEVEAERVRLSALYDVANAGWKNTGKDLDVAESDLAVLAGGLEVMSRRFTETKVDLYREQQASA